MDKCLLKKVVSKKGSSKLFNKVQILITKYYVMDYSFDVGFINRVADFYGVVDLQFSVHDIYFKNDEYRIVFLIYDELRHVHHVCVVTQFYFALYALEDVVSDRYSIFITDTMELFFMKNRAVESLPLIPYMVRFDKTRPRYKSFYF